VLLLLGVVAVLVSVEIAVRVGFERLSPTQSNVAREWRLASSPSGGSGRVVLLVGNSLLDAAVDTRTLQELVGGTYSVRRVAVVDTRYFDWLFGLRRLFSDGARPDVVALMIDEGNLIESRMRWDYTAHYLMNFGDVGRAGRAAGADRNRIFSMMLASGSAFWGSRVELRNFLLGLVTGGGAEKLQALAYRRGRPLKHDEYERRLLPRLAELCQVVSERGARLWLIMPPRLDGPWQNDSIRHVAERLGVRVLVPIEPGRLSAEHFSSDGYHMSGKGAAVFMPRLAECMRHSGTACTGR
jgi:hypothetical protein